LIDGPPPSSWTAGPQVTSATRPNAPQWDQERPGHHLDAPTIPEGSFPTNRPTRSLRALAVSFADLDVNARGVDSFESPGAGLALLADGTSARLADLHGEALCTTGSCVCPEGTPGRAPSSPNLARHHRDRATGHTSGSDVTVVGWSVDRYCQQERCQVGTWRSGAWHVPRVLAGGRDAPLWITREGEGYVDWSEAGDLYGVVQGGTTAARRSPAQAGAERRQPLLRGSRPEPGSRSPPRWARSASPRSSTWAMAGSRPRRRAASTWASGIWEAMHLLVCRRHPHPQRGIEFWRRAPMPPSRRRRPS